MDDHDVSVIEKSLGWGKFAERLEIKLADKPCDHTHALTKQILEPLGIWQSMNGWLKTNGVACDCLVLQWLKSLIGSDWFKDEGMPTLGKASGVEAPYDAALDAKLVH